MRFGGNNTILMINFPAYGYLVEHTTALFTTLPLVLSVSSMVDARYSTMMDVRPGTGSAEDKAFYQPQLCGICVLWTLLAFSCCWPRWMGTGGGGWRQGTQGETGRFSWRVKTARLGYRKPWLALSGQFLSSLHEWAEKTVFLPCLASNFDNEGLCGRRPRAWVIESLLMNGNSLDHESAQDGRKDTGVKFGAWKLYCMLKGSTRLK